MLHSLAEKRVLRPCSPTLAPDFEIWLGSLLGTGSETRHNESGVATNCKFRARVEGGFFKAICLLVNLRDQLI